jgi:diguanylate cyclase (GGDEF)-like protein/PAS domain S-box-containing protein
MLKRRAQHLFDAAHDVQRGWPHDDGEIGALARILRHVAAERAQLEQFNGDVLAKLGSVMAAAPVGILFTRDHRIELVSVELCRMIGKSESELLGQPARVLFASNEDYEALGPKVLDAFAQGHPYEGEWRFLRVGQPVFWGRMRGRPVDGANAAAGAIWTLDDITQHIAARERLEWQANHDALTGLANRKAFDKRVARVFEARPKSFPAAVVMIDLDHFKPINDKAGHAAGDAMLRVVAASITARVRASDLVARLGGDEFALLLERCPQDVALRIASNVQQSIAEIRLPWESDVLQVGASLGVASLNEQTPTIQAWLHDADTACYDAKAAGRGTVKAALPHRLRVVGSDTGDA